MYGTRHGEPLRPSEKARQLNRKWTEERIKRMLNTHLIGKDEQTLCGLRITPRRLRENRCVTTDGLKLVTCKACQELNEANKKK